jgi:uncharacterized pyridoxal phosphate-containing UPF0001 family protein
MTALASARERELSDALSAVRARLAHAAETAGRNADEIELLPITKFFPAGDVLVLRRLGCLEFGESREQEAANKSAEVGAVLGAEPMRWHMVGRIQLNKARSIAGWAYAAHSVDSSRVIAALDRAASEALEQGRRAEPLRVYLQLSLDGDESRGGVDIGRPDSVDELCASAAAADGLEFVGLMAIPPWTPIRRSLRAPGRRKRAGAEGHAAARRRRMSSDPRSHGLRGGRYGAIGGGR